MHLLELISQHLKIDEHIEHFFREETETKTYSKGEILTHQNSYSQKVFFMEKGLARVFYYENGKDITTNFYPEGRVFGNIDTIFTQKPTQYNIETLEESTITFCNYEKLNQLCEVSLPAANFSRYLLGNLMTQLITRLASLQHTTATERYAQLLSENPNIILRAPLGMVASYLGISQETLSRIRSKEV